MFAKIDYITSRLIIDTTQKVQWAAQVRLMISDNKKDKSVHTRRFVFAWQRLQTLKMNDIET